MSKNSTVGRNTIYLVVSNIGGLLVALIFNVFLARALGVEKFGEFSFAISFITLFSVVVDFSLGKLVVRDVARDPSMAGKYFANSLVLKGIFFVVAVALAGATATGLGYPSKVMSLLSISIFALLFDGVRKCCDALFMAAERMQFSATLVVAEKVLFALFGFLALQMHGSVVAITVCYVASQAVTQFVAVALLRRKVGVNVEPVDYGFCKTLARRAFSFFSISLIAAIYANIDRLFLFSMQGASAVGFYSAAYRLVMIPTRFSSSFHHAVYPVLSKHAGLPDPNVLSQAFSRSTRFLLLAGIPLAVGTTALAEPIMRLVYGKAFAAGTLALQILIWAYVLEFFNPLFSGLLFALNRQRAVLTAAIAGAGINILLNIILIPKLSFIGAAIATLISAGVIFALLFGSVRMFFQRHEIVTSVLRTIAASMIMWLALVVLAGMAVVPLALLGAGVYFTCLFLTKELAIDDLSILPRLLRTRG